MKTPYSPDAFQSPRNILPYGNTLGNCDFEYVAAIIMGKSQDAGEWVRIKPRHVRKHVLGKARPTLGRMVQEGFLNKKEGLFGSTYGLTSLALGKILDMYPNRPDAVHNQDPILDAPEHREVRELFSKYKIIVVR